MNALKCHMGACSVGKEFNALVKSKPLSKYRYFCLRPSLPGKEMESCSLVVYLGGVEFAVVQLQDVKGRLQVGLRLRQLHLDGPQTVDVRR